MQSNGEQQANSKNKEKKLLFHRGKGFRGAIVSKESIGGNWEFEV